MSVFGGSTTLIDLNDDCLIEIFKNCEIETLLSLINTCQHFKQIIRLFVLPKRTKFKFIISSKPDYNQSHRILRNIGKYLNQLVIVNFIDERHLTKDQNDSFQGFTAEISKRTGDNLRRFEIYSGIPVICFQALKPI